MTPSSTEFINLKDVSVKPCAIVAYGKMTLPETLQTPQFYAISLWLKDVKEPIVVTYVDVAERDAELDLIDEALKKL
jgi:hypothetical protein